MENDMNATKTTNRITADIAELIALLKVCVGDESEPDDIEEAAAAIELVASMNPQALRVCKRDLRRALAEHAETE